MFKKLFLHSLLRYVIAIAVAIIIFFGYFLFRDNEAFKILINYANATGIAGFSLLMVGLLSLSTYFGAFDIFSYGFSTFRGVARRYHDLHDYQEAKRVQRSSGAYVFMPYFVVGTFVLIISFVITMFL